MSKTTISLRHDLRLPYHKQNSTKVKNKQTKLFTSHQGDVQETEVELTHWIDLCEYMVSKALLICKPFHFLQDRYSCFQWNKLMFRKVNWCSQADTASKWNKLPGPIFRHPSTPISLFHLIIKNLKVLSLSFSLPFPLPSIRPFLLSSLCKRWYIVSQNKFFPFHNWIPHSFNVHSSEQIDFWWSFVNHLFESIWKDSASHECSSFG